MFLQARIEPIYLLKGIVHPEMNTLSSFSQPHVFSIQTIFFFSKWQKVVFFFLNVSLLFIILFYLQNSVGYIDVLDPFDFNFMEKTFETSLKYLKNNPCFENIRCHVTKKYCFLKVFLLSSYALCLMLSDMRCS